MTNTPSSGPKVPTERPDPEEAGRNPGAGSQDRPGFDLGGSSDPSNKEAAGLMEGGPKGSASSANAGRAGGRTDVSGSQSLGNEGDAGSDAGSGPTDGTNGPA
jgi:hypothetical protein